MALHLTDLDELVLRVRHPESRKYIEEAINAYRSGAYRSAIVATWIAVCTDIILKIRDLAFGGDTSAIPLNDNINRILKIENLQEAAKEMQKFESSILETAVSPLAFLTLTEKQHFERLKQDRNICAHPALTRDGELFIPPPEMTRLYIVQACQYLLCQPPTQGKAIIQKILKLIQQSEFSSNIRDVHIALSDPQYLGRAKPSTLKSFLVEMLKILLTEEPTETSALQEKIACCAYVVKSISREIYDEIFQLKFPTLTHDLGISKLKSIFLLLRLDTELWDKFQPATQTKLANLIKTLSPLELNAYYIVQTLEIVTSLQPILIERLNQLDAQENIEFVEEHPVPFLKKHAIETFINSESFNFSESSFRKCILPYVSQLTTTDLTNILQGSLKNEGRYGLNQITKAGGMPKLFLQFYMLTKNYRGEQHSELWKQFWQGLRDRMEGADFYALREVLEKDSVISKDLHEAELEECFF